MYDCIVVGSGPSGIAACVKLDKGKILLLDVGREPGCSPPPLRENLYLKRERKEDLFDLFVGNKFEGLNNIYKRKKSLKLKAPFLNYITQDWESLCPTECKDFDVTLSLAKGGLANAWGAGAYRFTDEDLKDFPISYSDLEPYYNELSGILGISGVEDDLKDFFGKDSDLLPPIKPSELAQDFLDRYKKKKDYYNYKGLYAGLPRLAVLTKELNGRSEYKYDNGEFFIPHNPAIYNPSYTLDELIANKKVEYKANNLVISFISSSEKVTVHSRDLTSGKIVEYFGKNLILAAGTINTARIVLESLGAYDEKVAIYDNPMSSIPIIDIKKVGYPLDYVSGSMAQLNLVIRDRIDREPFQASFYETTGPLRSDLAFELPFSIATNILLLKYLSPAMGFIVLFYPQSHDSAGSISLSKAKGLTVQGVKMDMGQIERRIIGFVREMGFFAFPFLVNYSPIGSGLHYAGCFPMKEHPKRLETSKFGELANMPNIYISDGACFNRLPAKNLTLTLMANSMRIADRINRKM